MRTLLKHLEKEESDLNNQIEYLTKRITSFSSDTLHVSRCNGTNQFYIYNEREDGREKKYLKKENRSLAASISQRDYERKLLSELQTRQKAIKRTRKVYEETDPEQVFGLFPQAKQDLIKPLFSTNEQYVRKWLSVEYERKTFQENTSEFYTIKGERVRSKSEKIIADLLTQNNIPYRYEFPLKLKGYGTIHPDFMVLNTETREEFFWEHLGKMDDEKYVNDCISRLNAYEMNNYLIGKDLLITFETSTMPINMKVVIQIIEKFLL